MNEKLSIKSVRLTTGSGIVLPAQENLAYRVLDWNVGFSAATSFSLYAGDGVTDDGKSGFDAGIMHSETIAASAYSSKPTTSSTDLFVTVGNMPVRIYTSPNRTPLNNSFIRYQEVPIVS